MKCYYEYEGKNIHTQYLYAKKEESERLFLRGNLQKFVGKYVKKLEKRKDTEFIASEVIHLSLSISCLLPDPTFNNIYICMYVCIYGFSSRNF